MRRSLWLFGLALLGSGACAVDNPHNCGLFANACAKDERCNMETLQCESLDCTVNTALCLQSEYCDPVSKQCAPRDCTLDTTICTGTQVCNSMSKQCATRTFVLGQPDSIQNLNAAYGMSFPISVLLVPDPVNVGKTKLLVGDGGNQRILIWNDLPTQNRPADAVLGAPDINTLNGGTPYGGCNELSVSSPGSLTSDGTRLVVADQTLNRLLVWSQIPQQPSGGDPIPANLLWGQSDFESSLSDAGQGNVNALGLDSPRAFLERPPSGTGTFFVSDRLNNRMLAFGSVPIVTQKAPDYVIGQLDFVSNTKGTTATTLSDPRGLASDGTDLFVADLGNNRILGYGLPIASSNPTATTVIGQASFTVGLSNRGTTPSALTLAQPISVSLIATSVPSRQLFVADYGNNRILRYTLPSTTADLVLGQADFVSALKNRGGPPTAATLYQPSDVHSDGTHLAVADPYNNRVLLWSSMPTVNGQAADVVLGQPNGGLTDVNAPPMRSALQFQTPSGVGTDGTRLAIADSVNNRVLIWNSIPPDGATPPDVVLGQPDFIGGQANAGLAQPTAATLSSPFSVSIENGHLAVADRGNNRILIWNLIPSQNYTAADFVIGQPNFTSAVLRAPAAGMNQPFAAVLAQGVLYVADYGYNRVLIYKNPLAIGPAADVVVGQSNINTSAPNFGGQSAKSLANPTAVLVDQGKLLISDHSNHRILIWNTIPMVSGRLADVVVGQTDFTSSYTHTDRTRLANPRGLFVYNGRLYVTSDSQNRILYWNQVPTSNGPRADGVLGQGDFTSAFPNSPELQPTEKLSRPTAISAAADQLFIADSLNNRVVVRGIP